MRGFVIFGGLAVALCLSGCSTDPLACGSGLIEHDSCQGQRMEAANDEQCRAWGAQPGTDGYLQCRMALAEQDASRRQAALQAWRDGMRSQQQPQVSRPAATDTTCTGGTGQVDCRSVTH